MNTERKPASARDNRATLAKVAQSILPAVGAVLATDDVLAKASGTERKPVDVLAVMDRAAEAAKFERDDHANYNANASGWWDRQRLDLAEARAAVDELIEANAKVLDALDKADANRGLCPMSRDEMRSTLRAAIGRVGGA